MPAYYNEIDPFAAVRVDAWPDGYGSASNEPVSNVLQALNGAANRMGRLQWRVGQRYRCAARASVRRSVPKLVSDER